MDRQELESIIYEKDGPIARIVLNRPDKANSQNSAMVWDVENSLKDAEADYAIKGSDPQGERAGVLCWP